MSEHKFGAPLPNLNEFRSMLQGTGLPVGGQKRTMQISEDLAESSSEQLPYITASPAEDLKVLAEISSALSDLDDAMKPLKAALKRLTPLLYTKNDKGGTAGWITSWEAKNFPANQQDALKRIQAWKTEIDFLRQTTEIAAEGLQGMTEGSQALRPMTLDLFYRCQQVLSMMQK